MDTELNPDLEAELRAEDEKLSKELKGESELPEEVKNTEEEPEAKADEGKEEEPEQKPEEKSDEEDEENRVPKVPYRKYKAEKEKRQNLESEISSLREDIKAIKESSMSNSDKKDELEELAEEYGVDPTFAKKLADNITSKTKSPISEEELKEWREDREMKAQDNEFNNEFDELLEVEPEAKNHKEALKKLAFSKYGSDNFKSLFYIFGKEIKPNLGNKKTAETTSNKKTDNTVIDYKTMTEEEALKLPADKFLEWADYQK